jgi:hypothetical protein
LVWAVQQEIAAMFQRTIREAAKNERPFPPQKPGLEQFGQQDRRRFDCGESELSSSLSGPPADTLTEFLRDLLSYFSS